MERLQCVHYTYTVAGADSTSDKKRYDYYKSKGTSFLKVKSLFWVLPRGLLLESWMSSQQPKQADSHVRKPESPDVFGAHGSSMFQLCRNTRSKWCFHQAYKFMHCDNSAREQVPTALWVSPDPSLNSHCSRPESRNQSLCASCVQQFLDKSFIHKFCVKPCSNSLSSFYNLLDKDLCSLLGIGG